MKDILTLPAGTRILAMGNEAIARGAVEADVRVATGYPGTPSSEVLETLIKASKMLGIYAEWTVNEKVAFEIALGAAIGGVRSLVTMKAPGINVASDSLLSAAYCGVEAGMVVLVADDPGPHTTQTEQDSRWYARLAKLPMLEPSTIQEAKDFTKIAFKLSESIKLPVILRTTTRINHSLGVLTLGDVERKFQKPNPIFDPRRFVRASMKWNRDRHLWLLEQLNKVENIVSNLDVNKVEGDGSLCIVTSGVCYQYVREALTYLRNMHKAQLEDVKIVKLGLLYPIPKQFLTETLKDCSRVLIVEELDPYIEESIVQLLYRMSKNIKVYGKNILPQVGELNPSIVLNAIMYFLDLTDKIEIHENNVKKSANVPLRPPPLCPGCPHRGSYLALLEALRKLGYRKEDVPIMGDIGCYALSVYPPLQAIWTEHAMGASIGLAIGIKIAGYEKPVIATIGDSTFFHTGLQGLIEAVHKQIDVLIIILDNETVAMTGHQSTPEWCVTESGRATKPIMVEDLVKALGVNRVEVLDPYDIRGSVEKLSQILNNKGVRVVVFRRRCSLLSPKLGTAMIDEERCKNCLHCVITVGCPAMRVENGKVHIEAELCKGCGVCTYFCPLNAIKVIKGERS